MLISLLIPLGVGLLKLELFSHTLSSCLVFNSKQSVRHNIICWALVYCSLQMGAEVMFMQYELWVWVCLSSTTLSSFSFWCLLEDVLLVRLTLLICSYGIMSHEKRELGRVMTVMEDVFSLCLFFQGRVYFSREIWLRINHRLFCHLG